MREHATDVQSRASVSPPHGTGVSSSAGDRSVRGGWRRRILAAGTALTIAVTASLALATLGSPPSAQAADGDPFACATGTVFIAQDDPTRLYTASQGDGQVTFDQEGPVSPYGYNAIGYRAADGYLYGFRRNAPNRTNLVRIGEGGVVTPLGNVTGFQAFDGINHLNQGTFGTDAYADTFFVRATGGGSHLTSLYAVDVTNLTAARIPLSRSVPNLSDIVFVGGYIWGFDGATAWRIDPATGQADSFATGIALPTGGTYGAQWVYGNGNVGLSNNNNGTVYQVAIADPASATPAFALVSAINGPASGNNDGAACSGTEVDLGIVKTGPAVYTPGSTISYTLTVTNHGPGDSSGFQVTDALPASVTGPTTTTSGCTITSGTLACSLSGLAVGASRVISVTGTVSAAATGTLTNTARVTGNEADPNPANDVSTTTATTGALFECTADVAYGLDQTGGQLLRIDTSTGSTTLAGDFGTGATLIDALALSPDGSAAYAVTRTGPSGTVYRYDPMTGSATVAGALGSTPGITGVYMGAVNPANGYLYVGGLVPGEGYAFYGFDPATDTPLGLQFTVDAPDVADGDLAFDSAGRAFLLLATGDGTTTGNQLLVLDAVPGDGSEAAASLLANVMPSTARFTGVAFGADGYLYASFAEADSTRSVVQLDPNDGEAVATHTLLNPGGTANGLVTDLASCVFGSTVSVIKSIDGRFAAPDQFALALTGNGVAHNNTGETSGDATGPQHGADATAGPILAVPGRTYAIAETGAGSTDLGDYTSSYECIDTDSNAVLTAGAGTTGEVAIPSAVPAGVQVLCTFTNTPRVAWELAKHAFLDGTELADGALVQPGDTITYRVTATNTTATEIAGVTLTDDLSDVLDDAAFVAGSAELTIGAGPAIAVADPAAGILQTDPFALPATDTAELVYQVLVDDDAWSTTVANVATGAAGPPEDPVSPECPSSCSTSQVTPTPLQVQKVGEDATGVVVPMSGSSWAVFATESGGSALVDSIDGALADGDPVVGLFRDTTLPAGTYWLEETRSLDGFELLAGRVEFTIGTDGTVSLGAGASVNVSVVDVNGAPTIRVEDVATLDLPDAGGPGRMPIYVAGVTLLAAAAVALGARARTRRPGARTRTSVQ